MLFGCSLGHIELKEGILQLFWYTVMRPSWYRSNAPWMFPWAYRIERGILQLFWYTVMRLSWGVNIYSALALFFLYVLPIMSWNYFCIWVPVTKLYFFQLPIIFKISWPTKWWWFCKSLRIFFTDFWYRSNVLSFLLYLLFFPLHYDIVKETNCFSLLFGKRHILQIIIFPDSYASCYILSWEANKIAPNNDWESSSQTFGTGQMPPGCSFVHMALISSHIIKDMALMKLILIHGRQNCPFCPCNKAAQLCVMKGPVVLPQ